MRKTLGVVVGVLLAVAIGFLAQDRLNSEVLRYASVFIGGLIAGTIGKEKGWLCGGMVGLVIVIILGSILSRVAYQSSHGQMFFAPEAKVLIPSFLTVVSGTLGGLVSGLFQRS